MIRLKPEWFPPKTMKKLYARGVGPFKILKKIRPNAYMLELPPDLDISLTFNVSDLIEYKELALIPSEPFEPDSIMSKPTFECLPAILPEQSDRVECILDDQTITTQNKCYQRYLVHWKGYPIEERTWEPLSNLSNAQDALKDFYSKNPTAVRPLQVITIILLTVNRDDLP